MYCRRLMTRRRPQRISAPSLCARGAVPSCSSFVAKPSRLWPVPADAWRDVGVPDEVGDQVTEVPVPQAVEAIIPGR